MELIININRFHPLLVHLPIGILLLVACMEIYQWRKKSNEFFAAIQFSLLLSFAFSCLAIFTGWRLAGEGGYDDDLVGWHKWLGIGMTMLTLVLYWARAKRSWWSPVLFAGVLILLLATGHNGGSLTHGSDYLFTQPVDRSLQVNDIEKANAFEAVIFPILNDKCTSCHNTSKLKGELLMTTPEGLLAGGEHGAIFDMERPEKSELLQRVNLPIKEKLHMPPKGKKQLDADEIKILQWWIENKACFDCIVEGMKGTNAILPVLKKYETVETDHEAIDLDILSDKEINELRSNHIKVQREEANSPFVLLSLSRNKSIEKKQLKLISNISEHVLELDLSESSFEDKSSWLLARLENLKKLRLQKTAISSSSLKQLEKLNYLEVINLYNTDIDDLSINHLKKISTLKRIYLWGTNISEKGMKELTSALPRVDIQKGANSNIFGKSELKKPELVAGQIYFEDTTTAALRSSFPGATIFYTLDGSEPDSSALRYISPIPLNQTTQLKYFAAKDGWTPSPVDSINFISPQAIIQSAKLNKQPNVNYPGDGARSLYDFQRASTNFRDGKWLGYQGSHFTASLQLAQVQAISKVYLGSITAQPSWIFYPVGFKIWTSTNGKDYNLAREIKYGQHDRSDDTRQKVFEIPFPKVSAKFVKIQTLSQMKNPEWHGTPGGASWVFIDEILIE